MKYITKINDKQFEIEITSDDKVLVNGEERDVNFLSLSGDLFSIITEYQSHEVVVDEGDGDEIDVLLGGRLYNINVLDERSQLLLSRRGGGDVDSGEISIRAPMPGLVVDVPVAEGAEVSKGQTVLILESMKMQNELKAPRDGVVQRVSVETGQSVEQNKVLVTIN